MGFIYCVCNANVLVLGSGLAVAGYVMAADRDGNSQLTSCVGGRSCGGWLRVAIFVIQDPLLLSHMAIRINYSTEDII